MIIIVGVSVAYNFRHHLEKYSVFPLLFGAEHYQSLEIALTNV
jgi:hypothetical protein